MKKRPLLSSTPHSKNQIYFVNETVLFTLLPLIIFYTLINIIKVSCLKRIGKGLSS